MKECNSMSTFHVTERFVSINGEARRAGELSCFIRLVGCNLACNYCDTRWSCDPNAPCELLSEEELYAWVKDTGVTNITLTGGEPLLAADVDQLLRKYNLTDVERGSDYTCIEHIYLLVDKDLSDDRIEDINAFLRGLRDIAIKDIETGNDFYSEMHKDFGYTVRIVKVDRSGEGDLMYNIKGNSAVDGWRLTADVEDSELDLRKMNNEHQRYTTPQAAGMAVVIRVFS